MQVAIDGPAGSGKSTVCKMVANSFNFVYVDTGAMYRAVTWLEIKFPGIDITKIIDHIEFILFNRGKNISIEYNGQSYDVTDEIRRHEVSDRVSKTAANPLIRKALVKKQQDYAKTNNVIMEGRDITTVVLPNADLKIFLTASPEERAKRRYEELKNSSDDIPYETVLAKIIERDNADSSRATSPMIEAEDAIPIDTTGMTLEEVCVKIGSLIERKGFSI